MRSLWESLEKCRLEQQIETNDPLRGGLLEEETPCWLTFARGCLGGRLGALDFLKCQVGSWPCASRFIDFSV